jgi:serine/threonine protein kinase
VFDSIHRMTAPRMIGPYRLESKLGSGGMGVVWRAFDTQLERSVAIKMMHNAEMLGDVDVTEIQERFLREARAAGKIKNRHVAQVLQLGRSDEGEAYIVLELLEGVALNKELHRVGRFPVTRALHIGKQICRAMAAAHAMGIIHRDLKPANVMLVHEEGDDDFVKVLDFGIAKISDGRNGLTQTGALLGTLPFMAPEQISGKDIDQRADIYSLGILLYRMFTGTPVFDAENLSDVVRQQLVVPPQSMIERLGPAIPITPVLDAVVLRCLEKDRNRRFSTMNEVLDALVLAATTPLAPASAVAPTPAPLAMTTNDKHVAVASTEPVPALGAVPVFQTPKATPSPVRPAPPPVMSASAVPSPLPPTTADASTSITAAPDAQGTAPTNTKARWQPDVAAVDESALFGARTEVFDPPSSAQARAHGVTAPVPATMPAYSATGPAINYNPTDEGLLVRPHLETAPHVLDMPMVPVVPAAPASSWGPKLIVAAGLAVMALLAYLFWPQAPADPVVLDVQMPPPPIPPPPQPQPQLTPPPPVEEAKAVEPAEVKPIDDVPAPAPPADKQKDVSTKPKVKEPKPNNPAKDTKDAKDKPPADDGFVRVRTKPGAP